MQNNNQHLYEHMLLIDDDNSGGSTPSIALQSLIVAPDGEFIT